MPDAGLYETALTGLLHDIGKFLQRRGIEKHHAEVAREYRDFFKSETVSGIDFGVVLKAVSNHHSPTNDFERIIKMADGLSASERDETDEPRNWQRPLASIFEQIQVGAETGRAKSTPTEGSYFYPIKPLSNELAYPNKLSNEERDGSKMADYRKGIEKGLLDELDLLNKRQNSAEAYFDSLFTLLKKYTTLVPSSTGIPPDISLFEHLKTTAAIACVLSQYRDSTGMLPSKEDKAFLLIGFELSGIQDFIYTIRSKKAAKSLRGRSFYVKLLNLAMERYLLDELALLAPNVVLSGGGRSYILAANTEKTRAALEAAKLAVQRYLLSEFEGRLGASLQWVEFSGGEFGAEEKGSFADVKKRLDEKLRDEKSRKFLGTIEEYFKPEATDGEACEICNRPEEHLDEGRCAKCCMFIEIGENRIRGGNYLIETYGQSKISFNLGTRQYHFTFADRKETASSKKVYARSMDETEKIIQETTASVVFMPYPLAGEGKTFETLAKGSEGINRIGFLRMDVDNLGRIFSEGLGSHATICRVSTLSFLVDYFFTRGVEEIAKGFENLYLVYSGGDDLFLVGAWNEAIICSTKIRAEFGRWACGNKSVGLSAGLTFSKEGFPIYVSAEFAKDALDRSKAGVKDKITAFADPLGWAHFNDLLELGKYLSERLKSKKISMSLLYSFLLLKKQYLIRRSLAFARTDYALARNVKDDQTYARLKSDIHKNLPYIETPAQYAAWLNRNNAKEVIGG